MIAWPVAARDETDQLALFNPAPYDEPDTLTREEFHRYRYTLADPPPTWRGRPFEDVVVGGAAVTPFDAALIVTMALVIAVGGWALAGVALDTLRESREEER